MRASLRPVRGGPGLCAGAPGGLLLVHGFLHAQLVGDLVGVVLAFAEGALRAYSSCFRLLLAPVFFQRAVFFALQHRVVLELGDLLVGEVAVGLAALGVDEPLWASRAASPLPVTWRKANTEKKICRIRPTIISEPITPSMMRSGERLGISAPPRSAAAEPQREGRRPARRGRIRGGPAGWRPAASAWAAARPVS